MNYLNIIGDLANHFEVDPVVVGELVDRRWTAAFKRKTICIKSSYILCPAFADVLPPCA